MKTLNKILFLSFGLAVCVENLNAQTPNYLPKYATSSTFTNSSIFDNGNVGIGTTPLWYAKLDVNGVIRTSAPGNALVFDQPAGGLQYISYHQNGVRKAWIGMDGATPNNNYTIKIENGGAIVLDGGIVRVNNKLIAKEIQVKLNVWSDYVFADNYQLPALKEVELFIKKNKHLPGINPGSEIETNGLNVGEMQAKHMQKIEELTLYVIDLNKRLSQFEKNGKE